MQREQDWADRRAIDVYARLQAEKDEQKARDLLADEFRSVNRESQPRDSIDM
jgi:hypothetical protein